MKESSQITLTTTSGEKVGFAKTSLFESWGDLDRGRVFTERTGGLKHYRSQLPSDVRPPYMVLDNLHVYEEYRSMGLGSSALQKLENHYRNLGASLGLLRIGGDCNEWIRNRNFYAKMGWHEFEELTEPEREAPFMWRNLDSGDSRIEIPGVELRFMPADPLELLPRELNNWPTKIPNKSMQSDL